MPINILKMRSRLPMILPSLLFLYAPFSSCKRLATDQTDSKVEQLDMGHVSSYSPERCFGAVGSKCAGAPRADVEQKEGGYFLAWVSVGSIVHDNCCLRNPHRGIWCQESPPIPLLQDREGPCSAEWRKAFNNTLAGLQWQHLFGPYPQDDDSFSDPLDHRNGRATKLPDSNHEFTIEYLRGETISTINLSAEPRTKLDEVDVEFCRFKKFSKVDYGIGTCADANGK